MIQKPYVPIVKEAGFKPNPVAGNIPIYADSVINPKVVGTNAYNEFWDEQIDRCINGYDTAGMHIPGRYYWYLNFVVLKGLYGPQYPFFVDLDLEYYRLVEWVKENRRMGIVSVKARRKGLSEKAQAILAHGLRFTEGYRGAITAGIDTYTNGLRNKFYSTQSNIIKDLRLNVLADNEKQYKIGYEIKDQIGGYVEGGYGGILSFETMYDDPTKLEGEYFHDVICEESGRYKHLGKTVSSIKPALEFGSQMIGTFYIYGCVCAGTKVWDKYGNLINIEDLKKSDGILGFDGNGISIEPITYIQPPAKKKCVRITTNTGRVLECSTDHPVLWSNKGYLRGPHKAKLKATKFVEACNIKPFDQIAVIDSVPLYGEKEMWEPRLAGWLIGDGSYGFDKTPVLCNCDDEINDYVLKNFKTTIERSHVTKESKLYKEIRIKNICSKLRELGIYGQTKLNKRLPVDIQSYRKEDICELLGGFFDTDGSVNAGTGGYKIVLTASSYDLLFEVQLLLQKLGIHCSVDRIKATTFSGKGGIMDYYRLSVCDKRSVIKFHENISFKLTYKQEKLNHIVSCFNNAPTTIRKGKPVIIRKGVEGMRFERVVSVEPIGMKEIYNLTAGNTHTYIANGIITHNTGGNILSTSKDFKDFWDNADTYGLERFWVPGSRLYYPFIGNPREEFMIDPDTGEKLDTIPNLRCYTPEQRIGMEDIKAAEEYILKKRIEYSKLPNKKKLKEHNQAYPLTVEEAFTSGGSNNFNDEKIYDQLFKIEGDPNNYRPVVLEWVVGPSDSSKGTFLSEGNNLKVRSRPATKDDPDWKVGYEYQGPLPDYIDLDIGGVDGYNQDLTQVSKSLGAMVVLRQGNRVNLVDKGIHKALYPVFLYYKRPPRKEEFFDYCLKIAVRYNLRKNTMVNAEQDFVIDYFIKNGGLAYLSPRPKAFDAPKSKQVHKYGAKMTGFSKELILGITQTWVENYVSLCFFPEMLRDALAYDEEYLGTDWDSIDALAYAIMRVEDMKTRPRLSDDVGIDDEEPEWIRNKDGNIVLKNPVTETVSRKERRQSDEYNGKWKSLDYDIEDRRDF